MRAARTRSTAQLQADLRAVGQLIDADANANSTQVGVIQGWIAQELRQRTNGLNGQPAI